MPIDKLDEHLKNIKCSKCGSEKLKLSVDGSFTLGIIRCENCGNFDTREIINGKLSNLIKCDICGSTTTRIESSKGYEYPVWHFDLFTYLDINVLCDKCKNENFDELMEKDKRFGKIEADNRINKLREVYKEEEKYTKMIKLTDHQLEYILGLIENDDDYATEMCLNEDIEEDYEFEATKKIYEYWQNNLKNSIKEIININ